MANCGRVVRHNSMVTMESQLLSLFKMERLMIPTTSLSPKMGVFNATFVICQISNGHISATDDPIHFMFGSTVKFLGSADRMALFRVISNPSLSKSCYSHIHELRCIRPYLHSKTAGTIAASIIHSKLDYCNSLYYNLPKSQINRLQQIQNCRVRTVDKAPKSSYHTHPQISALAQGK